MGRRNRPDNVFRALFAVLVLYLLAAVPAWFGSRYLSIAGHPLWSGILWWFVSVLVLTITWMTVASRH